MEQQEKLLQQHMESIKEAVDQVVKEKLEAMKHSMEDLYEEYRGRTVTEI